MIKLTFWLSKIVTALIVSSLWLFELILQVYCIFMFMEFYVAWNFNFVSEVSEMEGELQFAPSIGISELDKI